VAPDYSGVCGVLLRHAMGESLFLFTYKLQLVSLILSIMQAKFAGILIFFWFCLALFDYCCSLFVVLVVVFVDVDLKKKQNCLKTDDMELHAIHVHGPGRK